MITAYNYVRCAQDAMEANKRVATIAAFLTTSVTALDTDIAVNKVMGALTASFNSCMLSVIDAANTNNIPFICTYKVGQEKFFLLVIDSRGVLF